VVQTGTPQEVYIRPVSDWVARFLGLTNLLDACPVGHGQVRTEIGILQIGHPVPEAPDWESDNRLLIRPEAARLGKSGPNVLQGVVTERSFRGGYFRLGVRHCSGVEMTFNFAAGSSLPALGETFTLSLNPKGLMLLPMG